MLVPRSAKSATGVGVSRRRPYSAARTSGRAAWRSSLAVGLSLCLLVSAVPAHAQTGEEPPAQAETDDTPPTVHSATVDGTVLTLTFSETLRATNTSWLQFAFTVDGIVEGASASPKWVSISGDTVTLVLGAAAVAGQTVTVSYDAAAAVQVSGEGLQDTSGNPVASFSDQPVQHGAPEPEETDPETDPDDPAPDPDPAEEAAPEPEPELDPEPTEPEPTPESEPETAQKSQTQPQPETETETEPAAPPARPTGLSVTPERGSLTVTVDWDDTDGADSYRVRWRAAGAGNPLNEGTRSATSGATITVNAYGDWVVRVEACNDTGCGPGAARRFTVETTNQAPTVDEDADRYNDFVRSVLAPPGWLVNKVFTGIFTDPDGDDLTYSVSVPDSHRDLVSILHISRHDLDILFFEYDDEVDWSAVDPPLADPLVTPVTLTATDPDGLSVSLVGSFYYDWESQPIEEPATIESVRITSLPSTDTDGDGTADTYRHGDTVEVTVTWNKDITWDAPSASGASIRIRLRVGTRTTTAALVTGGQTSATTNTMVFRYPVRRDDTDTDGISIVPTRAGNLLGLVGSTVTDAQGEPASRQHTGLAEDPSHKVDGSFVPDTEVLVTPASITLTAGSTLRGGFNVGHLIDGSGLSLPPSIDNFETVTHSTSKTTAWVSNWGRHAYYYADPNAVRPQLKLVLHRERELRALVVWGYGGISNEAAAFTVEFSTDGGATYSSTVEKVQTEALLVDASARLDFSQPRRADTVRITVTDNARGLGYGGPGGDRVAMAELHFIATESARDEPSASELAARYIEDNFITPYQSAHPWLAEAWFNVPPKVVVTKSGESSYNPFLGTVHLAPGHYKDRAVVYQQLARHYTNNKRILQGKPAAMLSMLTMWLHLTATRSDTGSPNNVATAIATSLAGYTINGDQAECVTEKVCATVASASAQQVPQWFYDTYTSDGTLDTVDLEKVWAGFRNTTHGPGAILWMVSNTDEVFGGHCSTEEASRAQSTSAMHNPWVDGGCVNRRPQDLSATQDDAGDLTVSWRAPLHATAPAIDAYVVQWTSGDQDYNTTRRALVTDLSSLTHTITGLSAGTTYTVRVAAVNQADTADFDDDESRSRTAETTSTSALDLELSGGHGALTAEWDEFSSAASYRLQWRSADQAYSGDRQKEASAGTESHLVIIDGLDDDTGYTVRVAALDSQGEVIAYGQQSARTVSAVRYIEDNFITPYKTEHPWLRKAWFDVPPKVVVKKRGWPSYDRYTGTLSLKPSDYQDRVVVYRTLALHYMNSWSIHANDADGMLSALSLWLYQLDRQRRFVVPVDDVCWAVRRDLAEFTVYGANSRYHHTETVALADSVSDGEIPQWFYDTYTSDGTLQTVDFDNLFADFRHVRDNGCMQYVARQTNLLFGGHCSLAEARLALRNPAMGNTWVNGGCVNRRPQNLSATQNAAGDLTVSWQAPLYAIAPTIDAYVVQWKSGDQDYNTTRRAIVTDLSSLTHTITGLSAGTTYTVRVAAVNQADTADFDDNEGRSRTAETTNRPGAAPPSARLMRLHSEPGKIVVSWMGSAAADTYRVQWRKSDQTYNNNDRQKTVAGGSGSKAVVIEELDDETTYKVRVLAVDGGGSESAAAEQEIETETAHGYIEKRFIVPYQERFPWLKEAWFDVPVTVRVSRIQDQGFHGLYWHPNAHIDLWAPYGFRDQLVVYHELAHHYTLDRRIHMDNPHAMLSMQSLWLHVKVVRQEMDLGKNATENVADLIMGHMMNGDRQKCPTEELCATAASVSRQEIPQWIYDNYTTDGTLETVDHDKLWDGITMSAGFNKTKILFGGFCSDEEARRALSPKWDLRNPWVDGGCVNRRPQALTATAGGAGELVVSWRAPLYTRAPGTNAYVVQWKSGDEEYNTARQALVPKTNWSNASHTITGLTSGTDYTVRVAAVNQSNIAVFTDADGHERTAETKATAG